MAAAGTPCGGQSKSVSVWTGIGLSKCMQSTHSYVQVSITQTELPGESCWADAHIAWPTKAAPSAVSTQHHVIPAYVEQKHPAPPGAQYGATLWRTVPDRGELEARAQLPGHCGVVHAALWRAGGVAATLDDGHLRSWQLGDGRAEVGPLPCRSGFGGVQICIWVRMLDDGALRSWQLVDGRAKMNALGLAPSCLI